MEAAIRQHAHPNTVFHCVYDYYSLAYSIEDLATIYCKCENTIRNWIEVYETTGTYQRAVAKKTENKFNDGHRRWLFDFYTSQPLAYLDEAQDAFYKAHALKISTASVWRIIHDWGMTWKVLERRAMHIKEKDINRFVKELESIDWSYQNLVFLDEVSFDNRGMVRRRGYALRGQTLAVRGDFSRKPRVSMLAFLGVDGIIDYYHTEGTFDRFEFVRCCKDFVYSDRGGVRMYPGRNSVWILDGATIHRSAELIYYLRSLGIVPIFLPAYCPFFNPIEFMFGYIKRAFQRYYVETSGRDLLPFTAETFQRFETFSMANVFKHCGWSIDGNFSPIEPISKERRRSTGNESSSIEDDLDFRERGS